MDSILNAAALALSKGDLLGALNRIALRADPEALALRGVAMAQLGELSRARELLRAAAKAFAPSETVARARCVLAEAEIALVSRDLTWPVEFLEAARQTLVDRGDLSNAAHAAIVAARRHLLLGHLDWAAETVATLDPLPLPPALAAGRDMVLAGIAIRRLRAAAAQSTLARAESAAHRSGIKALIGEVAAAQRSLHEPVALLNTLGSIRALVLADVETLLASDVLVVDASRNACRHGGKVIPLSSRPVLMAIAIGLAEAWPGTAKREALLSKAFGARHADESHRVRLRVEVARLRKLLAPLARIVAADGGFRLMPAAPDVAILTHPMSGHEAQIMALLADGELWSSSALAMVLGLSTRSVQRSLQSLQEAGKIQPIGRGRSLRWTVLAAPGFPTALLMPGVA